MGSNGGRSTTAHDEFDELIAAYSAASDTGKQAAIRESIWNRFGKTGATFISDMANFSSTSRNLGICHFLKLIHRARMTVAPIVASNGGILLKCDADNCYAFFDYPDDAIRASMEINSALFEANQQLELHDHIFLAVGIDYGDLLLVGQEDFYGDPVNTASKLGEDLATKAETLVTDRALERSSFRAHDNAERMVARVSDIEINYVRFTMAEAVGND